MRFHSVMSIETRKLKNWDIILENSGGGPTQPVGRVVYFDVDGNEIYYYIIIKKK